MMTRMRVTLTAFAAVLTLAAGSTAFAAEETLSDSIENFLNDVHEKVKNTKIGPVHLRPSLRESVIWTDNIFLNDSGERNLRLNKVTVISNPGTPGQTVSVIKNRAALRQIERTQADFSTAENRGRVDDAIIQTELSLGFELPVNEAKVKAFGSDKLTLLQATLKNQEYLDENRLDNTSYDFKTDLFGFVSDLLNFERANEFWVRASAEHSNLRDPLDAQIRLVNDGGIARVDSFDDFDRSETTVKAMAGWRRNRLDAQVEYENYHLKLDDRFLEQAEHVRHTYSAEVGTEQDFLPEKRVFVRYDLRTYQFGRAPVLNTLGATRDVQVLNDADVHRMVVGLEGPLFSRRITTRVEAGYLNWRSESNGLSGDSNDFSQAVGKFRVAYKPWEERATQIQLEYQRTANYSAISNFNAVHDASLTYTQELMPRQLDLDINLGFIRTDPSDGPSRKMYEAGFGLTYHLFKQMDVTFRYLARVQSSSNEIKLATAFVTGKGTTTERLFEYEQFSDGDFIQNILELGVELNF